MKTEFIRKLSNFHFQCTKPCSRIISSIIAFFLTLFEGYKCNTLHENFMELFNNSKQKLHMGTQENKPLKASNFTQ